MRDVLTTEQAVARLREAGMKISRETLRIGLKQRVFPFGDAVVTPKSVVCYVYRARLEAWIAERFSSREARKGADDEEL